MTRTIFYKKNFSYYNFSVLQNVQKLPENILLMAASLLGCGINPEKSILFLQSQVITLERDCVRKHYSSRHSF